MPVEVEGTTGRAVLCADERPARRSARRPKVKSGEYEECITEKDKKSKCARRQKHEGTENKSVETIALYNENAMRRHE